MENNNSKSIIFGALKKEENRQYEHVELIASENYVSEDVLTLQGLISFIWISFCIFICKY